MHTNRKRRTHLSEAQIKQLRRDWGDGMAVDQLAKEYNVSLVTVKRKCGLVGLDGSPSNQNRQRRRRKKKSELSLLSEFRSYLDGLREGRLLALNGDLTVEQTKYLEGWDNCAEAILTKVSKTL